MATYNEIKGDTIEVRATDPANPVEGEVWYNSTTGVLKGYEFTASAMSSGGNLPLVIGNNSDAGSGTVTAGLGYGGYVANPPSPGATKLESYEYDGSTWTTGGNMNVDKALSAGAGTQTAAINFSGIQGQGAGSTSPFTKINSTEEYNGTSWATQTGTPSPQSRISGSGTQTAALQCGGTPEIVDTYEYNGSAWTAGGNLSTGRQSGSAFGTQTATLLAGGYTTDPTDVVESYNGTSWTSSPNLAYSSYSGGSGGDDTSAVLFVGRGPGPSPQGKTQEWDGSAWADGVATLGTNRNELLGACGTGTSAMLFGGFSGPTMFNATEEFERGFNSTKTLTTS